MPWLSDVVVLLLAASALFVVVRLSGGAKLRRNVVWDVFEDDEILVKEMTS